MAQYDVHAMTGSQATAQMILKIMYSSNVRDAYHMVGQPKPDNPDEESHWTAELLMNVLQRGRAVSLALVKDALGLLNKSSLVDTHLDVSGRDGYELRGAGRNEAGRLISVSA